MGRRRWIASAVGFGAVLALGPGAWAGAPTDQLQRSFAEATRAFGQPETREEAQERLGPVRRIVNGIFDFREAAKLSLGKVWDTRTPTEREEFVELFSGLLDRAYMARIMAMASLDGGPRITYVGETVHGDHATVFTTLASRDGSETSLDYRMVRRGEQWAVRDIVIDGLSLAENYRAQFTRVIQTSSYAELVRRMRAKASGALAFAGVTPLPAAPPAVQPPPPESPAPRAPMARPPAPAPRAAVSPPPPVATLPAPPPAVPPPPEDPAPRSPMALPAPGTRIAVPPPGAPPAPPPAVGTIAREARAAAPAPEARPARPGSSPTPAAVVAGRSYWVQVGAFTSPEAAARLAARLPEPNVTVSVPAATTGDQLLRVRLGPFPSAAEAAAKLRELRKSGLRPFIVQEPD